MTAVDTFTDLVAEHGLTAVMAVLAVGCVAVWCLLGVVLFALKEYRIRRAERKALADLKAEEAAWETFDIERGLAAAVAYANDPDIRAVWAHLPAPKGGGNA